MHIYARLSAGRLGRSLSRARGDGDWTKSRAFGYRRPRGFTMVELMITLAVAVVLLVIAIPNFQHMIVSHRLTTAANNVVDALNTARMEAVKLNADTQYCSNSATSNTTDTLGTACGTQTGAVWAVTSSGTTQMVQAATTDIATPLQLASAISPVRFTGQGLAYTPGGTTLFTGTVADICTSNLSSNNHIVISLAAGGSVISTAPATGVCP
jgi:type IV fimbrial biogenesis protein FimT